MFKKNFSKKLRKMLSIGAAACCTFGGFANASQNKNSEYRDTIRDYHTTDAKYSLNTVMLSSLTFLTLGVFGTALYNGSKTKRKETEWSERIASKDADISNLQQRIEYMKAIHIVEDCLPDDISKLPKPCPKDIIHNENSIGANTTFHAYKSITLKNSPSVILYRAHINERGSLMPQCVEIRVPLPGPGKKELRIISDDKHPEPKNIKVWIDCNGPKEYSLSDIYELDKDSKIVTFLNKYRNKCLTEKV